MRPQIIGRPSYQGCRRGIYMTCPLLPELRFPISEHASEKQESARVPKMVIPVCDGAGSAAIGQAGP